MGGLLLKISQVYEIFMEDTALIATTSRKDALTKLVEVMNACTQFIRIYPETTNICRADCVLSIYLSAYWFTQGGNSERISCLKRARQ